MAKDKEKEASKAPESEAGAGGEKKKSPMKMMVMAAAVVVLEIGTVGATMMLSGGPRQAPAETPTTVPAKEVEKDVEVSIMVGRLPNNQSGRLWMYSIKVFAKVDEKNKVKAEEVLKERAAEVQDRIRTIVASAEPKTLSEPGLETLRRQIGYQLEEDLGKDLIKELLIPECTPFRAEF